MVLKKLAVPFLAIALMVGGCGDDPPAGGGGSGGAGGARAGGSGGGGGRGGGGGSAASGGSTGSGGTTASGGSTGSGGSTTGDAGDAGEVRETGGETGGDTSSDRPAETGAEAGGDTTSADICTAYVAGSGSLAGISAADFCAKYATVCTFTGAMRYTDMADCMTKYNAVGTAAKTCRAGHLCNAAMPGGVGTHCPHATGMQVPACVGP